MLIRVMWDLGLRPSAIRGSAGPWAWWSAPCHGSWAGSYFGLAVIVSYLVLFVRLYNEKYKADKAAASSAAAAAASRAKSSMFKSQVLAASSSGNDSSVRRSPSLDLASPQFAGVATQEDLYDSMRSAWLSHPLVVAEKARWTSSSGSVAPHEEAPMEEAMLKPEAVLHRRKFGTDADRL